MQKKKNEMVSVNTSNVNVVDGKLIMSFPHADIPVVWQMDMDLAKACSIEVQEDKKKKAFTLTFKADGSESKDIASFSEKQDAVNALMDTSQALQSAHGKIRPVAQITTPVNTGLVHNIHGKKGKGRQSNTTGVLLAIILVLVLLVIWWKASMAPLDTTPTPDSLASSGVSSGTGAAGVPVSADDFLKSVQ